MRRWSDSHLSTTHSRHLLLSSLLAISAALHPGARAWQVFDVTAYGAVGDGHTLETAAVRRAAAALKATGGGELRFPAGETGPLPPWGIADGFPSPTQLNGVPNCEDHDSAVMISRQDVHHGAVQPVLTHAAHPRGQHDDKGLQWHCGSGGSLAAADGVRDLAVVRPGPGRTAGDGGVAADAQPDCLRLA